MSDGQVVSHWTAVDRKMLLTKDRDRSRRRLKKSERARQQERRTSGNALNRTLTCVRLRRSLLEPLKELRKLLGRKTLGISVESISSNSAARDDRARIILPDRCP